MVQIKCKNCGKLFNVYPYRLKSGVSFCSFSCRNSSFVGEKAYHWKGGIKNHDEGYIEIYSPQHPARTKCGYVFEHRLVMEKELGRFLKQDERVHHINKNKKDNRIGNLELFCIEAEHQKRHWLNGDFKNRKKK